MIKLNPQLCASSDQSSSKEAEAILVISACELRVQGLGFSGLGLVSRVQASGFTVIRDFMWNALGLPCSAPGRQTWKPANDRGLYRVCVRLRRVDTKSVRPKALNMGLQSES